jgi:hypothetical protein
VNLVDQRVLQPRETISMQVMVRGVTDRYAKVLERLRELDAQIIGSQLNEQNKNDVTASLDFIIPRSQRATAEKILSEGGDLFGRTVARAANAQGTVDTKVRMSVTIRDADQQPPRETATMAVEVPDVEKSVGDLLASAAAAGGRAVDSTESRDNGRDVARLVLDVPLAREGELINKVKDQGKVTLVQKNRTEGAVEGMLSRARLEVTLGTSGTIMRGEEGLWDSIRHGLYVSGKGLLWTLQLIVVGLCLVGPWVLLLWIVWRFVRRNMKRPAMTSPTAPAAPMVT